MKKSSKPTRPPKGHETSVFDKMARRVVRQAVQTQPVTLPNETLVYTVEKGWKSAIIENDPRMVEVSSLSEFEQAVRKPEVHLIYVPHSALVTIDGMKRVCARNAATKVVYKEVENNV